MPKGKLDEQAQNYVLQCLAEFRPDTFILKGLEEKHEIRLHDSAIGYYRRRFKADIERHRVEYLRDLASIELTHRKQRLLKLSEWLIHCEKGVPVWIKGEKGLKIILRPDYGLGLRILDAIREEMKEARFEAGTGADGEEVIEWKAIISKRFEQIDVIAREFKKKQASPPTKGHEVGEAEIIEDGSREDLETHQGANGGRVDQPPTDSTDPGTPTPPHEGEDG